VAFDGTDDRAKADWIVRAPSGITLTVSAGTPRAGTVRGEVTLG